MLSTGDLVSRIMLNLRVSHQKRYPDELSFNPHYPIFPADCLKPFYYERPDPLRDNMARFLMIYNIIYNVIEPRYYLVGWCNVILPRFLQIWKLPGKLLTAFCTEFLFVNLPCLSCGVMMKSWDAYLIVQQWCRYLFLTGFLVIYLILPGHLNCRDYTELLAWILNYENIFATTRTRVLLCW